MPLSPLTRQLIRWKCRIVSQFPAAEALGVLLGVLGFDLVSEGRANLPKALAAAALFAVVVMLWRCRRPSQAQPPHRPHS